MVRHIPVTWLRKCPSTLESARCRHGAACERACSEKPAWQLRADAYDVAKSRTEITIAITITKTTIQVIHIRNRPVFRRQQSLYFFPLPHGQGSFRFVRLSPCRNGLRSGPPVSGARPSPMLPNMANRVSQKADLRTPRSIAEPTQRSTGVWEKARTSMRESCHC